MVRQDKKGTEMVKRALTRLEAYKKKNKLSDAALSRMLKIPYNYLFRWRKKNEIIGVYKRLIEEFLEKAEQVGVSSNAAGTKD